MFCLLCSASVLHIVLVPNKVPAARESDAVIGHFERPASGAQCRYNSIRISHYERLYCTSELKKGSPGRHPRANAWESRSACRACLDVRMWIIDSSPELVLSETFIRQWAGKISEYPFEWARSARSCHFDSNLTKHVGSDVSERAPLPGLSRCRIALALVVALTLATTRGRREILRGQEEYGWASTSLWESRRVSKRIGIRDARKNWDSSRPRGNSRCRTIDRVPEDQELYWQGLA